MISIQDLGMQILNHNPQKFYIFGGCEYGIKIRYIEELEKHYGNKEEYTSVSDLLNTMNVKHIIPLKPTVYIVRYDEIFASQISEKYANKIRRCNIVGTVVCIYDNPKIVTKMDKYIPEFTTTIDSVNPEFIKKYLKSDFPKINDRLLNVAVRCSTDYGQAKNICSSMMFDLDHINHLSDIDIEILFGHQYISTTSQIRIGVASKNFGYLLKLIETYDGSLDTIIYTLLQTMIDLDKLQSNKYIQMDIKDYVKFWKREDIYYFFMHSYDQLKKLRSLSSYDASNSLIYLFGLLKFQNIPSLEDMNL